MTRYLNIHAHRKALSPDETVIFNHILTDKTTPNPSPAQEKPFSIGIHPWYPPTNPEQALHKLKLLANQPACRAIGEAGIDKTAHIPLNTQAELLIQQARIAQQLHRPLIIHCVKAWTELQTIRQTFPTLKMIVHGFRGKPELAQSLLRKGFFLSFGFRFNPQALLACPAERLFLETDEDNRSIKPLYLTAARLRNCPAELLRQQCLRNFETLFPETP